MNLIELILFFCITGTITGWLISKLTLWLIFKPLKEHKILGLKIQGLLPNRKEEISEKITDEIMAQLANYQEIETKVFQAKDIEELEIIVEDRIYQYLKVEIKQRKKFFFYILPNSYKNLIQDTVDTQTKKALEEVQIQFSDFLEKRINLRDIVFQKIKAIPVEDLNRIMHAVLCKDILYFHVVASTLGFLIALSQFFLFYFFIFRG